MAAASSGGSTPWGRKRTDLLVRWRLPGGEQRVVIELNVSQGNVEQTIAAGPPQTWVYMDKSGAEAGHLVIFDLTPGKGVGGKDLPACDKIAGCTDQRMGDVGVVPS
jgi:hypothetical protein